MRRVNFENLPKISPKSPFLIGPLLCLCCYPNGNFALRAGTMVKQIEEIFQYDITYVCVFNRMIDTT